MENEKNENYEKLIRNVKITWDLLDLTDLTKDIIDGNNLVIKRNSIPRYIFFPNGYYSLNVEYIMNEDSIERYLRKIINKYKIYIDLRNFVIRLKENINQNNGNNSESVKVTCDIELYIGLLLQILQAKLIGKTVEEIFK